MDQTLIPAGLEQLLQFAILLFVVFGFFRQFATQRDIERIGDRLGRIETRLDSVETRLGNVEAGQAALETRHAAMENQFTDVNSNVREIGKKVDASLDLHNAVRTDLGILQASVNRLDSYFETPKLKSS